MKTQITWILLLLLQAFTLEKASARAYDQYRSDYVKGAFCTAIAGACAADDDQESAYFQNPAALTAGPPDFSFDGDFNRSGNLEPGMKDKNDITESVYMGGFAIVGEKFGMGLAATGRVDSVHSKTILIDENESQKYVDLNSSATTITVNIPMSWRISSKLSFGVSIMALYYKETFEASTGESSSTTRLYPIPRPAFTVGAIYQPNPNFRFGSWMRTPLIEYSRLAISFHSLSNRIDYQEDLALVTPWMWSSGVAYMPFGLGSCVLSFDINIIGTTPDGYLLGYDTFTAAVNDSTLKDKGHSIALEPRLGFKTPLWKGARTSLLTGTFLEAARTESERSRVHVTGGVAQKLGDIFEFLAGVDVSRNFFSFYISFR